MTLVGKTHGNEFELQQVHVRWLCLWPRTCKKECREFEIQLFFFGMLVCYLNQIESLVKLLISKILVLIKLPYYYSCLPKEVFIVANATSNFSDLILVLIYDIGTNVSALSNLIYQEMTQVFSSCLEI